MIPEVDGVRIISSEKCEFLQKVPGATFFFLLVAECSYIWQDTILCGDHSNRKCLCGHYSN